MTLPNVALTDTFDLWRTRTNQLVVLTNDIDDTPILSFTSNTAPLTLSASAFRKGTAFFQLSTNSDVSNTQTTTLATSRAVSNTFITANAAFIRANAAPGQANSFATVVGTAGNTYATAVGTAGNTYTLAAFNKANTIGTLGTQSSSSVTITGGSITGITDLTVTDGGTGASDAATARTNLDVDRAGVLTGINTQTTNYTLVLGDRGDLVEMNSSSAVTLTIPANTTVAFPIGTMISLISLGTGQTSVAPAGGVTLLSYGSKRKLSGQYSMGTLIKKDSDRWYLAGDLMG
jgi:hypothetical protein